LELRHLDPAFDIAAGPNIHQIIRGALGRALI
jgi:hypothetical protein